MPACVSNTDLLATCGVSLSDEDELSDDDDDDDDDDDELSEDEELSDEDDDDDEESEDDEESLPSQTSLREGIEYAISAIAPPPINSISISFTVCG